MNKRKGPPYEIEFGSDGETPPPYVRLIMEDKIVLGGSSKEVTFSKNGHLEDNPNLIKLMINLNDDGFVFGYDPHAMISPSWFMQNIQEKGILKKPFKEISWRNPKQWLLTTYELV